MFTLIRALTYAGLFTAFLLVFVPLRVLEWAGIQQPESMGWVQIAGLIITALGLALALWCILAFAVVGRGTPAPFDPPRRLVVSGPYRWVRNPMYVGAVVALAGAALYCESIALLGYDVLFFVAAYVFVLLYEEPALTRLFGPDYDAYRARTGRWLPRRRHGGG